MALKNTIKGFDSQNDWLKQEMRREASISAWDLDDNASYLDAEHRQHCEASQVRKQHERACAVKETKNDYAAHYDFKSPISSADVYQRKPTTMKSPDSGSMLEIIIGITIVIVWLISFLT